jgi:hypothetical protein
MQALSQVFHAVTVAVDRLELPAVRFIERQLAPQPAHVGIHGTGVDIRTHAPDLVQQMVAGEELPRVGKQIPGQVEFLLREFHRVAVDAHPLLFTVELVNTDLQHGLPARLQTAGQCLDPGDELPLLDRLGQVIIRARAETRNDVLFPIAHGGHQHGGIPPDPLADLPNDFVPLHVRKDPVDHEQIEVALAQRIEERRAGRKLRCFVPCLPKPEAERLGLIGVVFHDGYQHWLSMAKRPGRSKLA